MFKRRRPVKTAFILLAVLFVLIGGLYFVDNRLKPTIYEIAQARAVQMATQLVNRSVQEQVLGENVQYQDIISIHKDNEGRIVMMQANTVKVNQMAANITLAVEKSLEALDTQEFYIPMGQVLGSQLLANYGPKVKVKITPIGTVKVNVMDKFEQAGINQTRHKIYLGFNTNVKIAVPLQSGQTEVATTVPIAESIIVGQVPQVVVNMSEGILSGGFIKK
ncbi:sporulation protein YunB [Desulfolucanica intricata]|uniref:sporulation protein YunB n=1 Tax=Desulfolucanica intricata TaxID=1285191 RepID=UPI0008336102|nr:sporulation protein YunB [Desulfolucanica intricata]